LPRIFVTKDEPEILRIYELLVGDKGNLASSAKDGKECPDVFKSELDRTMDNNNPLDFVV